MPAGRVYGSAHCAGGKYSSAVWQVYEGSPDQAQARVRAQALAGLRQTDRPEPRGCGSAADNRDTWCSQCGLQQCLGP